MVDFISGVFIGVALGVAFWEYYGDAVKARIVGDAAQNKIRDTVSNTILRFKGRGERK